MLTEYQHVTDRQTSGDSIVCAMHMHCVVKMHSVERWPPEAYPNTSITPNILNFVAIFS